MKKEEILEVFSRLIQIEIDNLRQQEFNALKKMIRDSKKKTKFEGIFPVVSRNGVRQPKPPGGKGGLIVKTA